MSPTHLAAALLMVTIWGTGLRPGPFGEIEKTPFASALWRD